MSPSDRQRTDTLTKQHPVLERVPYEERLGVATAARRHPVVLGTGLALLMVWLAVFGGDLIAMTGHTEGKRDLLAQLIVPVLIPISALLVVVMILQRRQIRRIVERDYAA